MLAASSAPFALFCDDDVWLEPGAVGRLHEAIVELGAGWWARLSGPVLPARPPTDRARTVRAVAGQAGARADRARAACVATLDPAQRREPRTPGSPPPTAGRALAAYKIAWVGGCVLYDRAVLDAVGGFDFWPDLPPAHCGEDVLVQHRVLARAGGAGILPSGAVHLESPTTVPDRTVQARTVIGLDPAAR